MESEREPTVAEAAELLGRHNEIRSRAARQRESRGSAWLQVVGSVLLSVYVGILLVMFTGFDPHESGGGPSQYVHLLLLPVLLFCGLVQGARDRFRVRTRPGVGQVIIGAAPLAAFMVLTALSIAGVAYPWWLNALIPLVLFAATASPALRRLRDPQPSAADDRWSTQPLPPVTRWTTVAIGAAFGIGSAVSTWTWAPLVWMAMWIALLIAAIVGWRMPWGLPRTGFLWGPAHWMLYGAATVVLFALAAVLSTVDTASIAVPFGAASLAFALLVLSSVIPLRTGR
ncbi:hypothetical protein [Agromyces seonyuensis]|uniref:Uncharacterized protein n=1 Tax=Agromyces seonyuensis TaxID=2662446 RepID=A0A6I4P055_9MICO|nr:hypothetical protein [Agromyces seonyuensis]MWB97399.1 hypothetical protein [Agromyces seonyuensis]